MRRVDKVLLLVVACSVVAAIAPGCAWLKTNEPTIIHDAETEAQKILAEAVAGKSVGQIAIDLAVDVATVMATLLASQDPGVAGTSAAVESHKAVGVVLALAARDAGVAR